MQVSIGDNSINSYELDYQFSIEETLLEIQVFASQLSLDSKSLSLE